MLGTGFAATRDLVSHGRRVGGGAATLFAATWLGVPVSTTHTITGGIIGVGSARRLSAVRWGVAGDIVIAWLVTMPAAALVGGLFYLLMRLVE